ncbi:MAG: hypothetical protein DCC67_16935 [Planctomycetota bacterium]|nr:MAG: hypothetical protein DCC67_16935 [Planctomycetota bacterium]
MSTITSTDQVEARLVALEKEVARLRRLVEIRAGSDDSLQGFLGLFHDDPDFAEIVRLGKEHRQSQRPETHG